MKLTKRDIISNSIARKTYPIDFYNIDDKAIKKEIKNTFNEVFDYLYGNIFQIIILANNREVFLKFKESKTLLNSNEAKKITNNFDNINYSCIIQKNNENKFIAYSENGNEYVLVNSKTEDLDIIQKLVEMIWYNCFEY